MNKPTPEQIEKLPAWARRYIDDLQRDRAIAVRELNEWCDSQTPSKIYADEMVCTGEETGPSTKRRYIQGNRLTFEQEGIRLDVSVFREDRIELSWSDKSRSICDVAFIPTSYQAAALVPRDKMRA